MGVMIRGNTTGVKDHVLRELEKLASALGRDILVTSAFRPGDTGEHGKGLAIDIIVEGVPLLDVYLTAERFAFTGIGIYPSWTNAEKHKVGGLHLDMRTGDPARWMGLGSGKTQSYVAFNKANLKLYGVI